MRKVKKQGFLQGAAVLALSGIGVKVIGAFFKIPIGALLGPEGTANFSIAYNIYALLFVLATAGVPVAVSKMVAQSCAEGHEWEAERIFTVSRRFFAAVGGIGCAAMYIGADFIANMMSAPMSGASIRAAAPAVLFVSFSAVRRGYHQGLSDMRPTAFSQLIEAAGKLAVGFACAALMRRLGYGTGAIAAGAVFGVSAGALFSSVYLALLPRNRCAAPRISISPSGTKIRRELIRLTLPITASAAVMSLAAVIDSALVMHLLQRAGYATRESMWLFGAYSYACNLFNLPSALISTLSISLIPAVSAAAAQHDFGKLNTTAESAVRIAMIFALPAAAGLFALAGPIMQLLYGGSVEGEAVALSAELLMYLAIAVPTMGAAGISGAIHQACGNVRVPLAAMLWGTGIKLAANCVLVNISQINIKGAAISTILCYTIIAAINFGALRRSQVALKPFRVFAVPSVLAPVTGLAAYAVQHLCAGCGLGRISVILAIFAGCTAFAVSALLLGIRWDESFKGILKGEKISKFLNIH